jgi:methionyl-tRNA formyltransferase
LFEEKTLKVISGKMEHESHDQLPGEWESDGKTFLRFATSDGWYGIRRLQLEGKKAMDVDEFLRGWKR